MLGVWFSPGPLTATQQRLGIRRYSRRCWEINPLCTRREVFSGLLEERPRCHSGRTEGATLEEIGRELKRCEKGEPFTQSFERAKKPKKLRKKCGAGYGLCIKVRLLPTFTFFFVSRVSPVLTLSKLSRPLQVELQCYCRQSVWGIWDHDR